MTDTYTAVLDRFEATEDGEELAVLLVEAEGDVVDEVVVDRERLPAEGRHENAVFAVTVDDDELAEIVYRPDETEARTEAAQSRFDRLSRRPPSDEDDADSP
ncbi:DUF3006 domain-containing protein [Halobacterium wangiae]|uniref:DUF3006 domain-containing protein n=1 Tax=Halobacterium wangiae TaxID=2902623 RepID=UPI001E6000CA|nr:DUF3006 domain-containing protein [Halobacterium wangiae]